MTHRSSVLSPTQQAERTATENYRALQAEVIGTVRHKLGARGMRLDESDLEGAYCQAWHGVCEVIKQGKHVSNLTGLLVEITWRRAVDIYRELRPGQRVDLAIDGHGDSVDLDAQLDDQIKLKRFLKRVRGRLNPRECEAVGLCVIHGYTRPEVAQMLGLERSQIEKLMDNAMKKIGSIVASINARGCGEDEWARLIKNYALGVVGEDDRDYPRAATHIADCEACRRYVNGLRGLAAILPPVVLPLGLAGAVGHDGSVLAHLEHLLRNGHGTAGAAGGAGVAGGATAGTVAGGGGGSLVGSLGTGTLLKGGALVLVAGAAAVGVATHTSKAHHHFKPHPRPGASYTQVQTAAPAPPTVLPASSITAGVDGSSTSHGGRGGHHDPSSRASQRHKSRREGAASSAAPNKATTEFGFENSQPQAYRPASTAPSEAISEQTSSRQLQTQSESASANVNHEFGFER